jgi:hypothetical protein
MMHPDDELGEQPNILPENFHERVVELEMKIEGRDTAQDETALIPMISELMGLYSVIYLLKRLLIVL